MPKVFVGTSGWAYAAWKPVFFPEKLPQKKFLQHYASRLNAVEVNYSFRRFIGESTLQNWIHETPPEFGFSVKAHQVITHVRRLKEIQDPLRRFLDSIQPLAVARKLAPVLFQLPPNLKSDLVLLDEFLAQLPRTSSTGIAGSGPLGPRFRAALEFRHHSWFSDAVFEVLRRHNAALCFAESNDLATPAVATADFLYYRFRRSEYSAEERMAIAGQLREASLAGRLVFAFFKHEERPESPLWAEEVLKAATEAEQVAADRSRKTA
jgi:uncharacterized protein YecE (DUF72 family)